MTSDRLRAVPQDEQLRWYGQGLGNDAWAPGWRQRVGEIVLALADAQKARLRRRAALGWLAATADAG